MVPKKACFSPCREAHPTRRKARYQGAQFALAIAHSPVPRVRQLLCAEAAGFRFAVMGLHPIPRLAAAENRGYVEQREGRAIGLQ